MNARFGGLYTRLHGPLPQDTDKFGPRAVLWQKEYQVRTRVPKITFEQADGVVSDNDLHALGIKIPPVLEPYQVVFSINGAGSTYNMGYPYDIGEDIEPLTPDFTPEDRSYWHQPIGYNTAPVPMNKGVVDGQNEFLRQLWLPRGVHGLNCTVLPWSGIYYSMGALVGMGIMDRIWHGDLSMFKDTFLGGLTFGNPRRQSGHTFPGCPADWSTGEGIATPTDHDVPDTVWEMACDKKMPGGGGDDLYTKMADDENEQTTKNMRAVWDIINRLNPTNLASAVLMLLAHPSFTGGYSAAVAALKALNFFVVKGTGPHVRYQFTQPIPNDPRDCWRLGRDHIADLVRSVPRPAYQLAA